MHHNKIMKANLKDLELLKEGLEIANEQWLHEQMLAKAQGKEGREKRYKSKLKHSWTMLQYIKMEQAGIRTEDLKKKPKSKKWLRAIEAEVRGNGERK